MMKYLRKHGTNEIFVWTERLAMRPDMVLYEPPVKVEDSQKEDVAAGNSGLKSFVPDPDQIGQAKVGDEVIPPDPNKVIAIQEAIATLAPEDFTKTGLPKMEAIEALVGFKPTAEERSAAVEGMKHIVTLPKGDAQE